MSSVSIKCELFAGTDINEACSDLVGVANRVGVLCEAKFNDVILWARPADDPSEIVKSYHMQMDSKSSFKIAQHRRL